MTNRCTINIRPGSAVGKGLGRTTYGKTRDYYYGDNVAISDLDDGLNDKNTPHSGYPSAENIHATFFLTGQNVVRYPDVVKKNLPVWAMPSASIRIR